MNTAATIATVDAWIRLAFWIILWLRASNALVHAADPRDLPRDVIRAIRRRASGWNLVGMLGILTGASTIATGRVSSATSGNLVYDAAATLLVGVLLGLVAWPALRVEGRKDDA